MLKNVIFTSYNTTNQKSMNRFKITRNTNGCNTKIFSKEYIMNQNQNNQNKNNQKNNSQKNNQNQNNQNNQNNQKNKDCNCHKN